MSPKKMALFLLSKIFLLITRIRNWLYDSGILKVYQSKLPVVSIGNISVGGNAKTPLCMFLAEELKKRNRRPVILTRGYRGSVPGPHLVKEGDSPVEIGDEAFLMFHTGESPVIVSRKRSLGARLIEREDLGDIIILDDGFQHRALARTVDIVSVNVSSPEAVQDFIDGRLMPYGRFREDRSRALERAHMMVFSGRRKLQDMQQTSSEVLKLLPEHVRLFKSGILPLEIKPLRESDELNGDEAVAFAGIANPVGFYGTIEEMGFKLVEKKAFMDHYLFSAEDLDDLREKCPGLPLICTEKDAVKIKPEWSKDVFVLRITTKVVPADAFVVQILKMIVAES